MMRSLWQTVLATTVFGLAACSPQPRILSGSLPVPAQAASASRTLPTVAVSRQLKVAKAAADFSFPTISGKGPAALNAYAGKIRLVHFFATWCPHCQHEAPDLVAVQKALGSKGFQIIALSLDDDPASVVPAFAAKFKTNFPIAGGNQPLWKQYGDGKGIPDSFLVDGKGQIVKEYLGPVSQAQVTQDVDALLARR